MMREGWYRLRALGRRRRDALDSRLDEEIRFHLEQQMAKNLRAGMDLQEAHRQAMLKFGGGARTRGQTRDEVRPVFLEDALRDLRYAIRTLQRSPRFTLIAVLTLALGIGANTAIFSVVDRILFRPLPYEQPERLVAIHEVIPAKNRAALTVPVKFPHFQAWRDAKGPFDQLAVLDAGRMTLTGTGEPERLPAARVSPSLFTMLGVQPQLGRLFFDQEDQPGRDHVVILSSDLWRRRFDADPRIVGRQVNLNDEPYEIVGVLPAGFTFPRLSELYPITIAATEQPQIWKPFGPTAADTDPRGGFNNACVARLAPGVSPAQALSALNALQAALPKEAAASDLRAALVPLQEQITGRSRTGLTLLLIAVGAVLLIACVNITNLLLARTMGRRRELGIRSALGASRGRLVAQLLVESLFLSIVGGLLGVLTAYQALRVIVINAPRDLPMIDEVHLDGRILLFTLGTSLVTGVLVGLLPAWRFGRVDCVEALKSGSASNTGASSTSRVRALLVGLEVGLSAICLMAAGLLLHSFDQLMNVDLGFEAGRVVTVDLSLPARRYPTNDARINFVRALVDGTGQLPGATSAGVANKLPLSGEGSNAVISADGSTSAGEQRPLADVRFVNPDYLRTMGIPLHTGRLFVETDRGRPVVVVSALTADRLWPHENALGKRLRFGPDTNPPIEVIGVAGDVRGASLDRRPSLTIYVPYWQTVIPLVRSFDLSLVVRGSTDALALSAGIRDVVHRLDPDLPLPALRTMEAVIGESVSQRRFQTTLVLLFACAATLLASLGVYGVVSYSVAQRTQEMGIRVALGARPGQIHRLVLVQSLLPVAVGLVAGLLIAVLALNRMLGALLFGIQATDPITLAGVVGVILTVAVMAMHFPARRATRVDPLRSLRPE